MNTEAKCSCQHCQGHIGFERSQTGLTVACPHCGTDTTLYLPPSRTRLSFALAVCLVVVGCALLATHLARIAGRKPGEAAAAMEMKARLEFLAQRKQAVAEGIRSRQLALNESTTELARARIEFAARATDEQAFNENFGNFLQGSLTLTNADYQTARTNYDAILAELRNAERAKLAMLRKQILQAKVQTINHFNNLSAQNQSLDDLRHNPLLAGSPRPGREGPSRNARAGALTFDDLSETERTQLRELRRFLAVSETLDDDVSTVLESIDNQLPLRASFRTARELRPPFRGAEELFLARANASLDNIVDRVRTLEDELRALKSEVKVRVMERRQAAQTRLKMAEGNLAYAELNMAGFPSGD